MRSSIIVLLLSLATGAVWLVKSHHAEPPQANTPPATSEVSKHNWAKHALDRTADVKRQVAQQRKEDGAF